MTPEPKPPLHVFLGNPHDTLCRVVVGNHITTISDGAAVFLALRLIFQRKSVNADMKALPIFGAC